MRGKYANSIRCQARDLFESGFGYKAVSSTLGLPQATVRDWKRQWRKGTFLKDRPTYAEALAQVMNEFNEEFVWSKRDSLIREAFRRSAGHMASPRYAAHCVMSAVQSSSLFKKLPIRLKMSNAHEHSVFKLIDPLEVL